MNVKLSFPSVEKSIETRRFHRGWLEEQWKSERQENPIEPVLLFAIEFFIGDLPARKN